MNKSKFKIIMNERARIQQDAQDNDYLGIEICCKETIDIIKEDISSFIVFLKEECNAQDFLFITEWFDELASSIKSQELFTCLRLLIKNRFTEENQKYHIEKDLDDAIKNYGGGILP